MTNEQVLAALAEGPCRIAEVTAGVADRLLARRPADDEWSANEVLAHLPLTRSGGRRSVAGQVWLRHNACVRKAGLPWRHGGSDASRARSATRAPAARR